MPSGTRPAPSAPCCPSDCRSHSACQPPTMPYEKDWPSLADYEEALSSMVPFNPLRLWKLPRAGLHQPQHTNDLHAERSEQAHASKHSQDHVRSAKTEIVQERHRFCSLEPPDLKSHGHLSRLTEYIDLEWDDDRHHIHDSLKDVASFHIKAPR